MRRLVLAAVLAAGSFAAPVARADGGHQPADPAHLAKASKEFDAGVTAFRKKDYEGAAAHFEEADAVVPSPKALRQAIRARSDASQGARAATLAAAALARYPGDAATAKLAKDTIEKYEPVLHKLHVHCSAPCTLSIVAGDTTTRIPGEPAKSWAVYLDPGNATVASAFVDASGAAVDGPAETVEAKVAGEGDLSFDPPGKKAAPPPPPADVPVPVAPAAPSTGGPPADDPKTADEPKPEEGKGISPVFFGIGAGATVALGAATLWSGVDTINNPGTAAVMMACAGKGPSCPLYQEGLSKQTRTNALVGATAGTAAVTVVLAIFTRWKSGAKPPPAEPTAIVLDRGAALGAAGAF